MKHQLKKLICKGHKGDENIDDCKDDELHPLIRTTHSGVGQGGILKSWKKLKKKNNLPILAEKLSAFSLRCVNI